MNRIVIAAAAAALGLTAAAAPADAQVNLRQHNQLRRIDEGKHSGSLSPREYAELRRQQAHIRHETYRLRQLHGGLTSADKRYIHDLQAQADRRIAHLKNNRRGRVRD